MLYIIFEMAVSDTVEEAASWTNGALIDSEEIMDLTN
jgi:hypothetical protein